MRAVMSLQYSPAGLGGSPIRMLCVARPPLTEGLDATVYITQHHLFRTLRDSQTKPYPFDERLNGIFLEVTNEIFQGWDSMHVRCITGGLFPGPPM
jgi:hypothetical protein